MFVVRAAVLLDLLERWHPDLARGVREIAADPSRLDDVWPGLTRIAIDHAVAEPAADAGRVVVVPAPFAWDDVGDFGEPRELLPPEHGRGDLRVLGDRADVTSSTPAVCVVAAGGRRVAVVGLDDVVVVDTPDALLVTTRARAQDVKGVVDAAHGIGPRRPRLTARSGTGVGRLVRGRRQSLGQATSRRRYAAPPRTTSTAVSAMSASEGTDLEGAAGELGEVRER